MKRKSGGERGTAGESQKPARAYHPETDAMPAQAGREAVVAMLSGIVGSTDKAAHPVPPEIIEALRIPKSLFRQDDWNFSSSAASPVAAVAEALYREAPLNGRLPEDIPDYGIGVYGKGQNTYLVLIDKSRKIAVMAPVLSYSGPVSWSNLAESVNKALERVKILEREETPFALVVNNRSLISKLD